MESAVYLHVFQVCPSISVVCPQNCNGVMVKLLLSNQSKLSMKKIYILVLACLAIITSCRQEKLTGPSEDYSTDLTANEAKTHFSKFVLTGAGKKKFGKTAQWDMVLTKKVNNRNVIVTPLSIDEDISIMDKKTGKSIPFVSLISLISYKDKKGTIHTEVVKRIPDDLVKYIQKSSTA